MLKFGFVLNTKKKSGLLYLAELNDDNVRVKTF